MHPRQVELAKKASELTEKVAAKKQQAEAAASPMLWKYVDPDGKEFWLKEKRMTVKSPYSGKSFTSRPTRETPSNVGKDLRDEARDPQGAGPGEKSTGKRKKKADWKA